MKLVGIDLATVPDRSGVCVLEEDTVTYVDRGSPTAEHPEWLVDQCSGADVVAVDVPFGWPMPFASELNRYEIGKALDRDRSRYRYRMTDAWITKTLSQYFPRGAKPPTPSSVTASWIGATAMLGTVLLGALSEVFQLSPRGLSRGPVVIEVYPAASLWAWGLPHKKLEVYTVLRQLCEAFDLAVSEVEERKLLECRDCFDALIAALTGGEYLVGNTFEPPDVVPEGTLRTEGWIRVPNRRLAESFLTQAAR